MRLFLMLSSLQGSKFTVLPTIFTAVYFSARSVAFPQQSAQARL